MNKSGKQQLNNEAVRRLMNKKQQLDNSTYAITDDLKNIILVDIHDGVTYKYDYYTNEMIECNTGDKSSKQNGYVYTELNLCIDGQMQKVNYGTHSLIAMCAYTEQYDCLVDNDVNPVVNHKDNCPWNNKSDNLEWTTQPLNVLHGKVVNSLYTNYKYIELMMDTKFTTIKHNNSSVDYITLLSPISVDDIKNYEQYILTYTTKLNGQRFKSLKDKWDLNKKESVISAYDIYEFAKWWIKRNNITKTV